MPCCWPSWWGPSRCSSACSGSACWWTSCPTRWSSASPTPAPSSSPPPSSASSSASAWRRRSITTKPLIRVVEAAVDHTHCPPCGWALLSIGIMFGLKRYLPKIPNVLVAVVITTLLAWFTDFKGAGGAVVGTIPEGLPGFTLPGVRPGRRETAHHRGDHHLAHRFHGGDLHRQGHGGPYPPATRRQPGADRSGPVQHGVRLLQRLSGVGLLLALGGEHQRRRHHRLLLGGHRHRGRHYPAVADPAALSTCRRPPWRR